MEEHDHLNPMLVEEGIAGKPLPSAMPAPQKLRQRQEVIPCARNDNMMILGMSGASERNAQQIFSR